MKSSRIFVVIGIVFLMLALFHVLPVQASDDQVQSDALELVKDELITKLKQRGYEDLADNLNSVDPVKIGDLFGSAAGGDFDHAFEIVGSTSADYLYDRFEEKITSELKEIIQPDSPLDRMIKYIPLTPGRSKKIVLKLLDGDSSAAGKLLMKMLREEGRENLKTLSEDITAGAIDWVLSPTVGTGAGALFIGAVKLEIVGIKWFEKETKKYLAGNLTLERYYALREQGKTPGQAVLIVNETVTGAFLYYPFRPPPEYQKSSFPINNEGFEFLEARYAQHKGITAQKLENKINAQGEIIVNTVADDLEKIKKAFEAQQKQDLLEIFTEVARSNAELKELIGKSKSARDKIEAIEAETVKLEAFWDRTEKTLDVSKIEDKKHDLEEQLAECKKEAQELASFAKCGQIDDWLKLIDNDFNVIESKLDRMRDIGRESRTIAEKICENKDDKPLVKKGIIALKKRFGYIGALKEKMQSRKRSVFYYVDQLQGLKREVKMLREKQDMISSSISSTNKGGKWLEAVLKDVDIRTESVDKLYAEVQDIISAPVFTRFKKKNGSIRYVLLGDAKNAKNEFYVKKGEITSARLKYSNSLKDFSELKSKVEEQKQSTEKALGGCQKLKNLDLAQHRKRIEQMGETYKRYKDGFKKLNREVKNCVGKDYDSLSLSVLDEAQKLLAKARERAGVVIGKYSNVRQSADDLTGMQSSAAAALLAVSFSSTGEAVSLATACEKAAAENQKLQNEIQAATGVSDGYMAELKESYVTASEACDNACEKAKLAQASEGRQRCEQLAGEAQTLAARSRASAEIAAQKASAMKSLYNKFKSSGSLKSLDEQLRKLPKVIRSLAKQIAKTESQLTNIDVESINGKIQETKSAAGEADSATNKVSGLVAQIKGLLAGIELVKADKIRGEAASILKIARSRNDLASEIAAEAVLVGGQATAQVEEARAKLADVSAVLERLRSCHNVDMGGNLNQLRTNSDMGEIFGPKAGIAADSAASCAELAMKSCRDKKRSDDPDRGNSSDDNSSNVNPFDSNYDAYANQLANREDRRSQSTADQVNADNQSGHGGGRFSSGGINKDLDKIQDDISRDCSKNNPCPPGFVCRDGKCVKKPKPVKPELTKPNPVVPSKPATLTVSPANIAVEINKSVNLSAVLTNPDGSTKDVSASAQWNPSPKFTQGKIGLFTVTANYQGLTATSHITVVKKKGLKDVTVNKKKITVTFWDHGREDGDMIDILINGKVKWSGITLTKAHQSRVIVMEADVIVVGFKALNEGKYPPNTATVTFSSVTNGKKTQKYSLKKEGEANLNMTYKP